MSKTITVRLSDTLYTRLAERLNKQVVLPYTLSEYVARLIAREVARSHHKNKSDKQKWFELQVAK